MIPGLMSKRGQPRTSKPNESPLKKPTWVQSSAQMIPSTPNLSDSGMSLRKRRTWQGATSGSWVFGRSRCACSVVPPWPSCRPRAVLSISRCRSPGPQPPTLRESGERTFVSLTLKRLRVAMLKEGSGPLPVSIHEMHKRCSPRPRAVNQVLSSRMDEPAQAQYPSHRGGVLIQGRELQL